MKTELMRRFVSLLSGSLLLIACAGAADDPAAQDDDLVKKQHHYVDVSADAPMTAGPREKLLRALPTVARAAHDGETALRRELAAETLARIEHGDVLLGSIEAA